MYLRAVREDCVSALNIFSGNLKLPSFPLVSIPYLFRRTIIRLMILNVVDRRRIYCGMIANAIAPPPPPHPRV